jgi:hypothetical protein
MELNHTSLTARVKKAVSGNNQLNRECNDGLAPWTRAVATPLFGWRAKTRGPARAGEPKAKTCIQLELFPDQLADGTLRRPQPVGLLEA